MDKIRVMIVEDTRTIRLFLQNLIGSDPRFEVAASVASGEEALRVMPRVRPNVVSLDIRLPGINGFEVTRRIMRDQPTPIVVCSASVEAADLNISMNALAAGALTVVEKPGGSTADDYGRLGRQLLQQLALMSSVKVVRQRFHRERKTVAGCNEPNTVTAQPSDLSLPQCIGIVASTGGPAALSRILADLSGDFPAAIIVVQHVTTAFHAGYVSWLDTITPLRVTVACEGEKPQAGNVYVAPGHTHLAMRDGRFTYDHQPPVAHHRPSGDVLLESMARDIPGNAVGVILTGMGQDGCAGMASLHAAGAPTLAEDASTAVVFGMPKVAIDMGVIDDVLPLNRIAARLRELTPSQIGVR